MPHVAATGLIDCGRLTLGHSLRSLEGGSREPVDWLYPVNERSTYYLEDAQGNQLPVTPENLLAAVRANPDRPDSWYLSSGFRSLNADDRLWIYAAGAHQYICALGRVVRNEQHHDATWHAILIWDTKATAKLERLPIARADVGQTPQHPHRANAAASKYLGRWLAGHNLQQSPASEPPLSREDARLRVLAEIVRRQGQTQFRNKLLDIYGGRCCATRETAQVVLEAAHISPYLGTKSNRPSNGLLLRADIHTLFNSHLIAVDRRGTWVVSSLLDGTLYAKLRGRKLLATRVDPPNARVLARHFALLRT